jgi:MFS family permease
MTRLRRAALFAGAFLGPFAGMLTAPILPELGASFGISADAAAASIMVYILPFSITLLISGRLAERFGIKRLMLTAYAVFVIVAIACALAHAWELFLLAYAVAGVSNAFISPLILAAMGRVIAMPRLGRSLGLYSALGAMGQLSAPLVSGLLAEVSWRYAFVSVAVVAGLLFVIGIPDLAEDGAPRIRSGRRGPLVRINPALVWASSTNLAVGACVAGMAFLVALLADASFDSDATERGVILMTGGVAALVFAQLSGFAVDRWGARAVTTTCIATGAAGVALLPVAGSAIWLACIWALATASAQALAVAVNKHVLGQPNGGAAISFTHAFRFFGFGLTPLLMLPIFQAETAWGFWTAAAILIAAGVLNLVLFRLERRGSAP